MCRVTSSSRAITWTIGLRDVLACVYLSLWFLFPFARHSRCHFETEIHSMVLIAALLLSRLKALKTRTAAPRHFRLWLKLEARSNLTSSCSPTWTYPLLSNESHGDHATSTRSKAAGSGIGPAKEALFIYPPSCQPLQLPCQ